MSGTGPKPKRNSFSAALDAACKRYGQATKEREQAVRKLDALNLEIPQLQETIKVLQKQTGKEVMPFATSTGVQATIALTGGSPSGNETATVDMSNIPAEIAKHLVLDLSSSGSIPAPQIPPTETEEGSTK